MTSVKPPLSEPGEGQTEVMTISLDDWEPLPDVSGKKLASFVEGSYEDSPLTRVIARLVKSLDDPGGVISSFSSFVET